MADSLRPPGSSYDPAAWSLLARYWHPVAVAEDVTEARPLAVTLLDVDLVVYRSGGRAVVAGDACPHRGASLSRGEVRGGRLVCLYHGLEFDGQGRCVRVPGSPQAAISDRLRIPAFPAEERYGLVWTRLVGEALAPIPDWSMVEQAGNQTAIMQGAWNASAGRHLENFCDLAHLSFTHAGTFGDASQADLPAYRVQRREHGLFFDVTVPILDSGEYVQTPAYKPIRCEFEVAYPFATRLTLHYSKGVEHICDAASPVSLGRSRMFLIKSRDHDQDRPLEDWVRFQEDVNEEDRAMVEAQRPPWIPLQPGAEPHLGSDRLSVAYRRHWTDQGLTTGI